MQNSFLVVVTVMKLFFLIKSPILPKTNPQTVRAKYGKLDKNPDSAILNPRA